MSEAPNIDKIIFLHLSGEANLEEIQELRRWLNSNPQNKEVYENMAMFWKNSKIELQAGGRDEAFSTLLERIKQNRSGNVKHIYPYPPFKTKNRGKNLRRIAAVIALLLVSVASIKVIENLEAVEEQSTEIAMVNKQNPIGQKSMIKLPDGSTVWLNAESSISYPEYFDKDERRIKLKGEAFFDIRKDENRPFIVEVNNIDVSVLGTQFILRHFRTTLCRMFH